MSIIRESRRVSRSWYDLTFVFSLFLSCSQSSIDQVSSFPLNSSKYRDSYSVSVQPWVIQLLPNNHESWWLKSPHRFSIFASSDSVMAARSKSIDKICKGFKSGAKRDRRGWDWWMASVSSNSESKFGNFADDHCSPGLRHCRQHWLDQTECCFLY